MNYADLAPIVAIDAMGAPEPLIVRRIAEAAHEFFRLSRAYKHSVTPAIVEAEQSVVAISPPSGTSLVEVEEVWLGSKQLFFRTEGQLSAEFDDWETASGGPRYYRVQGASVRLVPYPEVDTISKLRIQCALTPTVTAESIADEPGLTYQDALIDGAKYRLLSMPKKPWSSPTEAGLALGRFTIRLNEARILARNSGSSGISLRVRPRFL